MNFEQLYRTYGPMVLRRCRRMLGNEEDAIDAMQETFLRIHRRWNSIHLQGPSSLLYTVATRVCLNMLRKRARAPIALEPAIVEESWAQEPPEEERIIATHFADRLFEGEPRGTREMAALHYGEGRTLRETADRVGMSVSGVRKRLRHLRERGLALREA